MKGMEWMDLFNDNPIQSNYNQMEYFFHYFFPSIGMVLLTAELGKCVKHPLSHLTRTQVCPINLNGKWTKIKRFLQPFFSPFQFFPTFGPCDGQAHSIHPHSPIRGTNPDKLVKNGFNDWLNRHLNILGRNRFHKQCIWRRKNCNQ